MLTMTLVQRLETIQTIEARIKDEQFEKIKYAGAILGKDFLL